MPTVGYPVQGDPQAMLLPRLEALESFDGFEVFVGEIVDHLADRAALVLESTSYANRSMCSVCSTFCSVA